MRAAPPAEGVVTGAGVLRAGASSAGLYQIGSITKVFTALVLAREVVEGRLALDQPVHELLPELTGAAIGSATLGALASHTSGLPRLPPGMWRKAFGPAARDPYADIDEAALVRAVRSARLRRRARPAYSNLGFGLLGHAVSRHLGTQYDEVVRARVTGPLGMADTACRPVDPTRVVLGTTGRGRPHRVAWSFDAMAGAGALWSSVDDLVRFLEAQLAPPGGPLGEAIRLTHTTLAAAGRAEQTMAWIRLTGRDGSLLFHNGGTAGYRSFVAVDHGRGRAVVVLGSSDRSVDRRGMRLVQPSGVVAGT
jgi:D-alanyl-D-alanine-carboxypeptidase/D-alanyl-D-alanine-endopeptidase